MSENTSSSRPASQRAVRDLRYWKANVAVLSGVLVVWFVVSFGCGILFRDWFDTHFPKVGNAPFGFWMAQQGSIVCFVFLLIIYTVLMNRLDIKAGYAAPEQN